MTRKIVQLGQLEERLGLSSTYLDFARRLDEEDRLSAFREDFELLGAKEGQIYFGAHALGPMPKATPGLIQEELKTWTEDGFSGHSHTRRPDAQPWTAPGSSGGLDERYTDVMADLVGAKESEIVWMGGLTSNIHLLFNAFYRPDRPKRYKILYEANAFPSDRYALHSHVQMAGLDPNEALLRVVPRSGEDCLRTSDILDLIQAEGDSIALVFFGAVHWQTGQWLDMEAITRAGKEAGCVVGWDCAHAAGNVPMNLHEWGVDFASWCTYKYLFSGPGATAGVFVHERNFDLPRQAGWWGQELDTRFVHCEDFIPRDGAKGFAISNPSVFGTMPVHGSMLIFDKIAKQLAIPRKVVIEVLHQKSTLMTGLLEHLLSDLPGLHITSPLNTSDRGSCLGVEIVGANDRSETEYSPQLVTVYESLKARGIIVDRRAPALIRLSPSAVYNTYTEVWRVADAIRHALS